MKPIYLDHAAATPLDPVVAHSMKPYWTADFANPGSLHAQGRTALKAISEARKKTAAVLRVNPDEIYFTGGGTESINLALLGYARAHRRHGNHIITTAIEHAATLESCRQLRREGFTITIVPVPPTGIISVAALTKAITTKTILISVMMANNEIGTIQPISEIGTALHKMNRTRKSPIAFHTDACQAGNYLSLNIPTLHVDLLSLSGCKLYGPKGVGLLYARRGLALEPIIYGGGQERGWKSGTENTPGIVGLATALQQSQVRATAESKRLSLLRNFFWSEIQKIYPKAHLNGDPSNRLPNNLNVSFPGFEGETLLYRLDKAGIAVSTGSACSETSQEPSHVLRALHSTPKLAASSIRFSLGRQTKKADIHRVIQSLKGVLAKK